MDENVTVLVSIVPMMGDFRLNHFELIQSVDGHEENGAENQRYMQAVMTPIDGWRKRAVLAAEE